MLTYFHPIPPGKGLSIKRSTSMIKKNYSLMLLDLANLTVSIFQSLPPHSFWSITFSFPDLIPKFRNQVRLVGSHGLQGGFLWLKETDQAVCPLCKSGTEDLTHFLLKCSALKDGWEFFRKAYFLKLKFAAPTRLALSKYFLSILMLTQNVGFS